MSHSNPLYKAGASPSNKRKDTNFDAHAQQQAPRMFESRPQIVEKASQVCDALKVVPVEHVRALVQDLVARQRLPAWTDLQHPIASATKARLCTYLRQHLNFAYTPRLAQQWCSELSKNSVVQLRKLYTDLLQVQGPKQGVRPRPVNRMYKHDLCTAISDMLHEPIPFEGHYEEIIENAHDLDLPPWMLDVVSNEVMTKPMVTSHGQTLDESTYKQCRDRGQRCPITRQELTGASLNVGLRDAISQWLMDHLAVSLDQLKQWQAAAEDVPVPATSAGAGAVQQVDPHLVPDHEAERYRRVERSRLHMQYLRMLPRGDMVPTSNEMFALREQHELYIQQDEMMQHPDRLTLNTRMVPDFPVEDGLTPYQVRNNYRMFATSMLVTIHIVYGINDARAVAYQLNKERFTAFFLGFPLEYAELTTDSSPRFARYFAALPAPVRRPTVDEMDALHNGRLRVFDIVSRRDGDAVPIFGPRELRAFVSDPSSDMVEERERFRKTCARLLVMIEDVLTQDVVISTIQTINAATARAGGHVV
jgi:hypothetical protein